MSRLWGVHYADNNITALFLEHHSPMAEELRIIENLEDATCLLLIGTNDPRRMPGNLDVPFYTAVRRELVPLHIRKSGTTWINVYCRKSGEPLNGGPLREYKSAIAREQFETPHDEYEAIS